jgi:hypothetical protein
LRTSLAAALIVVTGTLLPFLVGQGLTYMECLGAHWAWTVATMLLWFLVLRFVTRRLMELSMRRPGRRLRAGEDA